MSRAHANPTNRDSRHRNVSGFDFIDDDEPAPDPVYEQRMALSAELGEEAEMLDPSALMRPAGLQLLGEPRLYRWRRGKVIAAVVPAGTPAAARKIHKALLGPRTGLPVSEPDLRDHALVLLTTAGPVRVESARKKNPPKGFVTVRIDQLVPGDEVMLAGGKDTVVLSKVDIARGGKTVKLQTTDGLKLKVLAEIGVNARLAPRDYKVAYTRGDARRVHLDGGFTLSQATVEVKAIKRRGMNAWVEMADGTFVPIPGVTRRPGFIEDNPKGKTRVPQDCGVLQFRHTHGSTWSVVHCETGLEMGVVTGRRRAAALHQHLLDAQAQGATTWQELHQATQAWRTEHPREKNPIRIRGVQRPVAQHLTGDTWVYRGWQIELWDLQVPAQPYGYKTEWGFEAKPISYSLLAKHQRTRKGMAWHGVHGPASSPNKVEALARATFAVDVEERYQDLNTGASAFQDAERFRSAMQGVQDAMRIVWEEELPLTRANLARKLEERRRQQYKGAVDFSDMPLPERVAMLDDMIEIASSHENLWPNPGRRPPARAAARAELLAW